LSVPVKPEILGVLGKEHFAQRLQAEGETLRYTCKKAIDQRGLPYLIECAFAATPERIVDAGQKAVFAGSTPG
jgi:hypothetical protein